MRFCSVIVFARFHIVSRCFTLVIRLDRRVDKLDDDVAASS